MIKYSNTQLNLLILLRVVIGWHFLYEGLAKALSSNWSSVGYLLDSKGWFAPMFVAMASNPQLLQIVDFINVWGLIAVGLGLMLGFLSRYASIGGIILLSLYYLSHPPMIGLNYALPSEGSYLFVNKVLLEILAISILLVFPTSHIVGLDRLIFTSKRRKMAVA